MASNRAFVIVTRELYEEFRALLKKVGCDGAVGVRNLHLDCRQRFIWSPS